MAAIAADRRSVDRRPLRMVRQRLREVFEAEFDLWCYDDEWRQIPPDAAAELEPAAQEQIELLAPVQAGHTEAYCVDLPDGDCCLVIPFPKHQRRFVAATSRFTSDSPRRLTQLARLFLTEFFERAELERMRHEHQAFLRQVTNDFEELTFLRSMSRLLEISDLSFDCVAMAETMLPTLKPLLDTDTLMLVPAQAFPETLQSGQPVLEKSTRCGVDEVPNEVCVELVRRYRDAATIQPVVKNNFQRLPDAADFPGVHSFILVPIVNGDWTIGWLLALNRNNDRNLNTGELTWEVSYLEFGTHEATLMSSSAAILATHARNVELFRERENLLVSVVRALVSAIEAKDEYTRGHSERVALYAKRLAEELGHDSEFCERLYLTGLLHDVGKIGVRDAVLSKPAPLTDEEFEEIKQHPDMGWQILHDLAPLQYVLEGVLHHHEQFDGRGYPDCLAADAIPLDGRILAVADAYDAMTSDRPYRTGMPHEKAETILRSGAGKQWDPEIVDAFFRCMEDVLNIKHSYEPRTPEQRPRRQLLESATPADPAPSSAP